MTTDVKEMLEKLKQAMGEDNKAFTKTYTPKEELGIYGAYDNLIPRNFAKAIVSIIETVNGGTLGLMPDVRISLDDLSVALNAIVYNATGEIAEMDEANQAFDLYLKAMQQIAEEDIRYGYQQLKEYVEGGDCPSYEDFFELLWAIAIDGASTDVLKCLFYSWSAYFDGLSGHREDTPEWVAADFWGECAYLVNFTRRDEESND